MEIALPSQITSIVLVITIVCVTSSVTTFPGAGVAVVAAEFAVVLVEKDVGAACKALEVTPGRLEIAGDALKDEPAAPLQARARRLRSRAAAGLLRRSRATKAPENAACILDLFR